MKIKFILTKNQIHEVMRSLNVTIWLFNQDWEQAFNALHSYAFNSDNNHLDVNFKNKVEEFQNALYNANQYKPGELDIDTNVRRQLENLELTFEDAYNNTRDSNEPLPVFLNLSLLSLNLLKLSLETTLRIALGQWDNLGLILEQITDNRGKEVYPYYFCNDPIVNYYRNRILPVYDKIGHKAGSTFSIRSEDISEPIRILYEVYKVLLYEWKPIGVNTYPPVKTANNDEPLPVIEFPSLYMLTYDGDYEHAVEKLSTDTTPFICRKPMLVENNDDTTDVFLPIDNPACSTYCRLDEGDKIYRKLNGYYVVVGRDSEEGVVCTETPSCDCDCY